MFFTYIYIHIFSQVTFPEGGSGLLYPLPQPSSRISSQCAQITPVYNHQGNTHTSYRVFLIIVTGDPYLDMVVQAIMPAIRGLRPTWAAYKDLDWNQNKIESNGRIILPSPQQLRITRCRSSRSRRIKRQGSVTLGPYIQLGQHNQVRFYRLLSDFMIWGRDVGQDRTLACLRCRRPWIPNTE